jgi:hypothetical protein
MDVAGVRALAQRVLDGADRLDEIHWPTLSSDDMTGSAVGRATTAALLEDRLADVVAHMRTWAAEAQASATALDQAELRHAGSLGEPR